jgi:hypothetical protein
MINKNFIYNSLDQYREFILTEEEVSDALQDWGQEIILAMAENEDYGGKIEKALVSHAMGSHVVNNIKEVKIEKLQHDAEGTRFKICATPIENEK